MAMKLRPLSQQVIVLTGACNAIGICTAGMAAALGCRLVLVARHAGVLDSLLEAIESAGGQALYVEADVAVRGQVLAAAEAAISRFGRIDTWINNAGVAIYGRLDEVGEAESRRLFDVNFWGAVNGSLAALPHLAAAGGSLINVGSEVPGDAAALQGMYSSSKHAVKAFTDALRVEIEEVDQAPVSITLVQPATADAGPPVDPMQVAEAILRAAAEGGRDVQVGAPPAATAAETRPQGQEPGREGACAPAESHATSAVES